MIEKAFYDIQSAIPDHVVLVAVSKTKPEQLIKKLYDLGQKDFGENKVQELVRKHDQLPKDINWHMIGHLQTNKVKYIASFVSLIHAVDSLKLLKEIDKQAKKNHRVIDVLLQVHIAQEDTKFGLNQEELMEIVSYLDECKSVRCRGLMGMASFIEDKSQIQKEFSDLKQQFDEIKTNNFHEPSTFDILSMGMSGDFLLAIEEGSTMVRIGSSIFGERS